MTTVLQNGGGFLNRISGGAPSKNCLACSGKTTPEITCHACQSHVCKSCIDASAGEEQEMRKCESCSQSCCRRCRDVCHDPDCQAVHCTGCSTMEACHQCDGIFCTEAVDDIECASRCTCDEIICTECNEECNLCNAILCDACVRECAECSDVFCKACENFVVTCEFCDKEYCLICCAKKTPCVSCGKKPSRPRLIEATAQLKRVQQGFQASEIMIPPVAPIAGPGVSAESANATAAAAKDEEAERRAKEDERKKLQESKDKEKAAELEKKKREAAAAAAKKQREEEAAEEEKKQQRAAAAADEEERRKRADDAAAAAASASAAGAQQQLQQQQQKPRGTNMMPKKAKKKKGKKKGGGGGNAAAAAAAVPAQAAIPIRTELPPPPPPVVAPSTSEMDHSVIKEWVLEVASRRVLATPDEIKRYFHGRVDEDVIDFYNEEFSNCRATVIQCAEFLNIEVPPDDQIGRGDLKREPEDQGALGGGVGGGASSFARGQEDEEEEDDDINSELVAGAFGAKERTKHGDYSAFEHPLERRANEAKQNDCKDLNVLNAILQEAHGEVGLGKMKKMIKKMVKRINETREEQKKLRTQSLVKPKREVSAQKLHPAYASKEPTFSSFAPSTIPDKVPDAMLDIPPNVVGWVIGKNGARINDIQSKTNAAMWMDQNFPDGVMRKLHIHGNKQQVEAAIAEVEFLMKSAPVNTPRPARMGPKQLPHGGGLPPGHPDLNYSKKTIKCPHALVGYLIGKKGAMIKHIKSMSNANVELFQGYPDGHPRDVFITGTAEEVDLAATLVDEVIASGTASDNTAAAAAAAAGVGRAPSFASGPFLGFNPSSALSQGSSTPPSVGTPSVASVGTPSVSSITHNFGDLGGLGNGGAAAAGMNGHPASAAATQMAIDNLHRPPPPPGMGGPAAGAGAPPHYPPGMMGAHEEYLAQQEALARRHQIQSPILTLDWQQQQHQQHHHQQQQQQQQQHQQHQQQQQQHQHQHQHQPPPPPPPPRKAAAPAAAAAPTVAPPAAAAAANTASPPPPQPFNSVEELLAKAGQMHLLPNFLEQEFDVNAIVLMEEQDFDEIKIPFGPQKKIQKAIREAMANMERAAAAANGAAAAPAATGSDSGGGSGGGGSGGGGVEAGAAAASDDEPRAADLCAICMENPIEVTFVGCGHFICCVTCGNRQVGSPCPLPECRIMVEHAVQPYTG